MAISGCLIQTRYEVKPALNPNIGTKCDVLKPPGATFALIRNNFQTFKIQMTENSYFGSVQTIFEHWEIRALYLFRISSFEIHGLDTTISAILSFDHSNCEAELSSDAG
ncbi:MAG: hypothetical protein ABUK19_06290 [Desulfobacteria bacterium]